MEEDDERSHFTNHLDTALGFSQKLVCRKSSDSSRARSFSLPDIGGVATWVLLNAVWFVRCVVNAIFPDVIGASGDWLLFTHYCGDFIQWLNLPSYRNGSSTER